MIREFSSGGQHHDPRFSDSSSAFFSMGGNEDLSEGSAFLLEKTAGNEEPKTLDKESQADGTDRPDAHEGLSHSHENKTPNHADDERKQAEAQVEATVHAKQHVTEHEDISDAKTPATDTLREISAASEILTQPDTHRSNNGSCPMAEPEEQKRNTVTAEEIPNDQNVTGIQKRRPAKAALRHLSRTISRTSSSVRGIRRSIGKKSEQVNKLWNFVLSQAMGISSLCGLLSVLFLSLAVISCSWRSHEFQFEDRNGNNTISVFCSLDSVRRIHQLKRFNETGTLYLLDKPRKYADLIDSPYCLEDPDGAQNSTHSLPLSPSKETDDYPPEQIVENQAIGSEPSSRRLAVAADQDAREAAKLMEGVEEYADLDDGHKYPQRQDGDSVLPAGNSISSNATFPVKDADSDSVDLERVSPRMDSLKTKKESEGLFLSDWALAPFQVIFGRDPAASGNMTDDMARVRRTLLGPAVYELNCRYLPELKKAGEAFWSLVIPAFVFAAIGLLCSWLCTTWGRMLTGGLIHPSFTLKMLGTLSWIVSLVLLVAGLGAWGTTSDVAACVSAAGGSTVCKLGISSGIAVIALALNLLATIWFCVHFTDRHITDLKLEASQETGESSAYERELASRQGAERDLEAGKRAEHRHASEDRHIPKIVVGNAEELEAFSSDASNNGHQRQGSGNHLRNLVRQITQLASTLLLKLVPPVIIAFTPASLQPAAPQAAAIIASTISEAVLDLSERI
ncbi:putative transmembrane protein [Toxoplasma gondii VAND]|uniref:Putative transmembrane protein n=2 Tax=Toxoplasma gondii TaxID=5811 RepID=A0A3R7YXY7_TOXGO|nr:putative transmembrane protein [Toxoplasma gondii VAND]RQX75564.1 putative transmembrane protein [Toxoplasma gondii CAST]